MTFVRDEVSAQVPESIPALCKESLEAHQAERDEDLPQGRVRHRDDGSSTERRVARRRDGAHGDRISRTSVVDPRCRVHGYENLYVVDSCSLPSPGAVNTGLDHGQGPRAADHIAHKERGARLRERAHASAASRDGVDGHARLRAIRGKTGQTMIKTTLRPR